MNGVPLGNDPRVRVSHLSSLVEETRSIGPMVQDLLGKREQEALPYKIRVSYTYSIPPFFPDRPALDPNVFFAGSFIRFSRLKQEAYSSRSATIEGSWIGCTPTRKWVVPFPLGLDMRIWNLNEGLTHPSSKANQARASITPRSFQKEMIAAAPPWTDQVRSISTSWMDQLFMDSCLRSWPSWSGCLLRVDHWLVLNMRSIPIYFVIYSP